MEAKKELCDIVQRAKAHEWTPELFIRCRELLGYVDVFNALRANLPPDEYEQFDIAYCDYIRPEGAALNRWLIKERKVKEWGIKEAELLNRKRQLLKQKLQRQIDSLQR